LTESKIHFSLFLHLLFLFPFLKSGGDRAPNESRFLAGTHGFIRGNTHGFGSPVCRYPVLKKPARYRCQMWELPHHLCLPIPTKDPHAVSHQLIHDMMPPHFTRHPSHPPAHRPSGSSHGRPCLWHVPCTSISSRSLLVPQACAGSVSKELRLMSKLRCDSSVS